MSRDSQDELELLAALSPAVEADDDARRAARTRLEHTIVRRPKRRWPRAFALAPVAAALAAAYLLVGGSSHQPSPASAALETAALHIVALPSPTLGEGRAWYVHTRGDYLSWQSLPGVDAGTFAWLDHQHHKQWVSCDGARHFITTDQPGGFVTPRDHAQWLAAGRPKLADRFELRDHADKPFYFLGGYASCAQVRAMPTAPDKILAAIQKNTAGSDLEPPYEALDTIAQTLVDAPLSAEQAAALYRTAARLPGIELLGQAHDHVGRPGLAVAIDDHSHGYRLVLIIDAHTGRLLGKSNIILRADPILHQPPGADVGWTVYLAARVARAAG